MTQPIAENRVVVRGAGEMASGVIRRLVISGFDVIALEKPEPCCVRRYVCFAEAYFRKETTVEGISAVLVDSVEEAVKLANERTVPLLIDPQAVHLSALTPAALIDGRMLKEDISTNRDIAPVVIGLGPGFVAGQNCHAAVETNRGDNLGRVFYSGHPQEDTGVPSAIDGFSYQRVLRSPANGTFISSCKITDRVKAGQVLAEVDGRPIVSEIDGMVRGMIHDHLTVYQGQKIGDIDPRGIEDYCYRVSDKADAIGRGTLEALMALKQSAGLEDRR